MPAIQMKTTEKLPQEIRNKLTVAFGRIMETVGKPEAFLMISFEEESDLRFAGEPMDKGALISIQLVGQLPPENYQSLTREFTNLMEEELSIPPKALYITYQTINDWGWNGVNF